MFKLIVSRICTYTAVYTKQKQGSRILGLCMRDCVHMRTVRGLVTSFGGPVLLQRVIFTVQPVFFLKKSQYYCPHPFFFAFPPLLPYFDRYYVKPSRNVIQGISAQCCQR